MSLLLPLGLLGFLGLAALILIYILKPNYQQKVISSTFVWKLSLKYRRKSIPISRFRNLLILLCQIIVISCCALIMGMPAIVEGATTTYREEVLILDSSASMYAQTDGETRFDRAVDEIEKTTAEIFSENGVVTIIVAGNEATCIAERASAAELSVINEALSALTCSYGVADVEGAMDIAEEVLLANPSANVRFYTATKYQDDGKNVIIEDVSKEGEWNVAILGAKAELIDNYYTITIDVACYGVDRGFDLHCQVQNANGAVGSVELPVANVECYNDETFQVVYTVTESGFGNNVTPVYLTEDTGIYSFERIFVHIDEGDSLTIDNEYYIYGGTKPSIKIEYYSTTPNNFISGMLLAFTSEFYSDWDITITEVNAATGGEFITEGFDLYIFEHEMPDTLPTDGVVVMLDPDKAADAGFTMKSSPTYVIDWSGDGAPLEPGSDHPITEGVDVSSILITRYTEVSESSLDGYDVLMYYNDNPVFFVKNEENSKVAVMAFSLHYSNLALSLYFPMLFHNLFEYYFPVTISGHAYSIYDTVTINARGTDLKVSDSGENVITFDETPAELYLNSIGTYTITQRLISGIELPESIYVAIPRQQSNIVRTEEVLADPVRPPEEGLSFEDLLVYFAAVAVALLMLEWLLQWRKGV